jgi:hypothetical protein
MGIELLEERYQEFITKNPDCVQQIQKLADRNSLIQLNMRSLLDAITAKLCPECTAPCCQCMPVEGWFTEADYFVYRAHHDAPFDLRVNHGIPNGCAFLGDKGCVLAADSRPFPCVKVNCKNVTALLKKNDAHTQFTRLYEAMDALQEKLWPLIHRGNTDDEPCGDDPA